MSIQRTSKPSGSSSVRIIAPTAATPCEVQRAAVSVHQPLEQGDIAVGFAVDRLGHKLLLAVQPGLGGDGKQDEQGKDQEPHGRSG